MANIVTCDCKPLARIFSYGDSLPVDGVDLRTSIKDEEYYNNQEVTELDLPYCKSIGKRAFYNSSLTEIIVPACTKIDDYAFYRTYEAAELKLKNADFSSVTEIGDYAFAKGGWPDHPPEFLSLLSFPSIRIIGDNAFENFDAQRGFTIDINNVTEIGNEAFFNSSLNFGSTLILPNCTKIGNWSFGTDIGEGCYFNTIKLPKIKTIGSAVFRGLKKVEENLPYSCEIGPNCTSIGNYFNEIAWDLTIRATTPPTLGTLSGDSKIVSIKVPHGCKEAYTTGDYAGNWAHFSNIITELPAD